LTKLLIYLILIKVVSWGSKPTVWDGDLLVPSDKTALPDAGGMGSFFKLYLFFKTYCLAQDS